MIFIGLDIGSTTLSAVAIDADTHTERDRVTVTHQATLPSPYPWEHIQDPIRLAALGCDMIDSLCSRHQHVAGIGLSGQMHGIIYTDAAGKAVSPFYTWQDRRSELHEGDGPALIDELVRCTKTPIMSGYGLATHIWNLRHHSVPAATRWLNTICSYMAMQLTGSATPALHPSDAASLGFYDVSAGQQEVETLLSLGVDPTLLPPVIHADSQLLAGYTARGIPVYYGLGDNQASFLGTVEDMEHGILLNIGTGSQISRRLPTFATSNECELRPLIGKDCIAVGSGLCGGRAFALMERFLRSCAALAGHASSSLFEQMTAVLDNGTDTDLRFDTLFCGTRHQPGRRAVISNLSPDNFTPAHFIRGVLRGVVEELYGYFQEILTLSDLPVTHIYCSGNLIRRTPKVLQIVEDVFQLPATMGAVAEEAAFGAALYAEQLTNARKFLPSA